jgi:hypothetical protein
MDERPKTTPGGHEEKESGNQMNHGSENQPEESTAVSLDGARVGLYKLK